MTIKNALPNESNLEKYNALLDILFEEIAKGDWDRVIEIVNSIKGLEFKVALENALGEYEGPSYIPSDSTEVPRL